VVLAYYKSKIKGVLQRVFGPYALKELETAWVDAAFQYNLKRRAHMLIIASVNVQNIRQFVAIIAS